jgi:nicotinamide-nucleotide amidase
LARLGKRVLSAEGDPMEVVVGKLLRENKATIAIAESCTGGLISHLLTNVSGSSDYFLFTGVTYSNQAKMDVLGVSPDTLAKHGAVSKETVKEMAAGARKLAGATYGIATSGIAGPTGGTKDKPVGTVCIGISSPTETKAFQFCFSFGIRMMNKEIFAMAALDALRRELLGINQLKI